MAEPSTVARPYAEAAFRLAHEGGALANNSAVSRYDTRAVAFCALAVAVVALVELVGS